jgi:spoIIIJ-associated protein
VREVERSAASVEEAIEAALAVLGVSEQEATIQILQEPKGGFLGLGIQEAVVRVRVKEADLDEEELRRQGELAADFLEDLLERMGVPAEVDPVLEDGVMYVDVVSEEAEDDDLALLIGHHGQTLDALQELSRIVVARKTGMRCRFVVDVEDYRRRRRSRLSDRARQIGRRVQKTGRPESLEPMSPYERKIVHDVVAELPGVESLSEGEGPDRHVIVRPSGRAPKG